jgi:hypothetical protein
MCARIKFEWRLTRGYTGSCMKGLYSGIFLYDSLFGPEFFKLPVQFSLILIVHFLQSNIYFPGPWKKQNKPTRPKVNCFTSMGLGKNRTSPLGRKLSVLLAWALKATWEHGEVGSIVGAITGGKPFVPPLYSHPYLSIIGKHSSSSTVRPTPLFRSKFFCSSISLFPNLISINCSIQHVQNLKV